MVDLNDVMLNGGIVRVNKIQVLFDNPQNLNYYGSLTGFYIKNALGWTIYFKCRDRKKAQEVADMIFGKNMYRVQAKV